ncbi:WD40-repeat-containing domain protein, partial [Mycena haematopus]
LKIFLETKFLYWLEALSLTSRMLSARDQLLGAKESIGALDVHLGVFVADAIKFVEVFQECISKSAPHIYLSAMTFTPENSKIYQTYSPLFRRIASLTIQTVEDLRGGRSAIPAPIIYLPSGDEIGGAFEGHVGDVLSTVFIQNGYVASASYDGTIRFWNPEDGAPVLTPFVPMPFATHPESITSVAFSEKACFLVAGSRDGDTSIWDMKSHDILATLPHHNPVTCVSLSPTSRVVITGCKNGTVTFWDIESRQECRQVFRDHTEPVTSITFLEDEIALSGSLDKSIEIWDSSTGKLILGPLAGHTKPVTCVAFSDDGQRLVSGAMDHSIRVWNVGSGDGASLDGFPDGSKMESTGWIRDRSLRRT